MELWWLIGGTVLILLELIIPGAVLVFLGLGALLVAGLLWTGVVEGIMPAFTTWFVSSLMLILLLRGLVQRWGGGDEEWGSTDEDAEAMNKIVEVTETVAPGKEGRIVHQGSTWPALCYDHTIEAGAKARLVIRDNVAWVVEPVTDFHQDTETSN